ncbi:Membrane proteinase PrsW, cleaves anti-sigma factor RsiW, M82 family [Oceanobacillus limi]|uniref:Protease PrsW n=1 Tax=Oceanobacillus limi TaxID=930131 RepID=A0A1H9ZHB3_9BACI|nr:glutamic-type intramembrane protease PrsW [Oceanobacillus limi]SES81035.1 Membrane proteinase PrsW, cleaves anti-sigma factor RsiW, M82 family [Oceanobacillus limi]
MFTILSAGIAPGLALLSFFYLKDHITEPLALIVRTFIFGCLLVFPIMFIQYAFATDGIDNTFLQSFVIVGFSEEFFKWFIFLYVIYHHTQFDAHYDGIVYAVSISLGFATVENILYLLNNGIEYAFSRALFPVSSHALFGVIMGYHFGKAKINTRYVRWNIILALVIPFLLHGTYNYILKAIPKNSILIIIPFMVILWFIGLRRVRTAHHSQVRPVQQLDRKNA